MVYYQKILFDKSIYEKNLLESRSRFSSYENESNFKNGITNEVILTDGWKGHYFNSCPSDIDNLIKEDYPLDKEESFTLPRSCELLGLCKPQYVNTEYPFDGYNRNPIGEEIALDNPCFVVWNNIKCTKKQLEGKVLIDFKGFESGLFVYINGIEIGYSENLYLDSEFDITEYLHPGINRICAICFKYSSSSFLLDQDFFRFMGFFRDISLFFLNKNYVFDIDIRTDVDSKKINLKLIGDIDSLSKDIQILDNDKNVVYQGIIKNNETVITLDKIDLWSAETPNLYTLIVTTKKENKTVEIVCEHFGFKSVKIENGILLFNGKRLRLKGINRHEWSPERGRNISLNEIDFDMRFLKEHNVNAIRTSHYPNRNEFYTKADETGFYVMDEACLESHGAICNCTGLDLKDELPASKMEWLPICKEKARRMYLRDKNHPCIFMYSLGNEAGGGEVFVKMRDELKKLNNDILIHYQGVNLDKKWAFVSDVTSTMYYKPNDILKVLNMYPNKPYIQCEYAHAMGNSLGNMDEYMQKLDEYPCYQGGFIWDYIDQGLYDENHHLCYGGDYLDKPNDHDFCCNGVIPAEREKAYTSSKAIQMAHSYQPFVFTYIKNKFYVKNDFLFTDSKDYEFKYEIIVNQEMKETHILDVTLEPQEIVELNIELPKFKKTDDVIIRLYAKKKNDNISYGSYKDFVINCGQGKLLNEKKEIEVIEGHYNIGVKVGNISLLFAYCNLSFERKGLISLKVNDEEYIKETVVPTIFRPTTNNDRTNDFLNRASLSLSYSNFLNDESVKPIWTFENNIFEIKYNYVMDRVNHKGVSLTYRIDEYGNIIVRVDYEPLYGMDTLPLLGVHFVLPKTINGSYYFGRTMESYPDRKDGNSIGLFNIDDIDSNYIYPQEYGNHEDTRYIEVKSNKSALRFSYLDKPFSFHFLPHSAYEIEEAKHQYDLAESKANHLEIIGLMRGIGGDDSWGAPVHSKYEIDGKVKHSYSFVINAVND